MESKEGKEKGKNKETNKQLKKTQTTEKKKKPVPKK
jgi:hypothetical protein